MQMTRCDWQINFRRIAQYNLSDIPASFLNCESSFQCVMETIQTIERSLCEEHDVQLAYSEFVELIKNEMDLKIPKRKQFKPNHSHKTHKSSTNPYWTSELQDLWGEICKRKRIWLENKRGVKDTGLVKVSILEHFIVFACLYSSCTVLYNVKRASR